METLMKALFVFARIHCRHQTSYLSFTVGLLGVADGGVGDTIFRLSLHREDHISWIYQVVLLLS